MNNKKRVGVMTFWESKNNYGQILQLFAMQQVIKKLGFEVFAIRYERRVVVKGFLNNCFKSLKLFVNKMRTNSFYADKIRQFSKFKSNYIIFGSAKYSSFNDLKMNPPPADVYLVGSDQVWNTTFKPDSEPFFLGFGGKEVKRIAYAASIGTDNKKELKINFFEKYLPNFSFIGVRESSAVDIVQSLGFKSDLVLDPTLLLSKDEWISLLSLNVSNNKNSVFSYILGNSKHKDILSFQNYLNSFSASSIINVTANNGEGNNTYLTIEEWILGIANSKFVITNSFHGVVFCLIFNVNFVVIPNNGSALGMNTRIDSLLNLVEMTDHFHHSFDIDKLNLIRDKDVKWDEVNNVIDSFGKKSLELLNSSLN